ncbi:MAG: hypothetical protein CM15mP19_12240 [Gammaproteobacteria bacterium]|nr:MAG: hypothetical protein CM15mP19_12240 [Gammaproteobacteria bacterium]
MPNVLASSGTIGTTLSPMFLSLRSFVSIRTNTIVVERSRFEASENSFKDSFQWIVCLLKLSYLVDSLPILPFFHLNIFSSVFSKDRNVGLSRSLSESGNLNCLTKSSKFSFDSFLLGVQHYQLACYPFRSL